MGDMFRFQAAQPHPRPRGRTEIGTCPLFRRPHSSQAEGDPPSGEREGCTTEVRITEGAPPKWGTCSDFRQRSPTPALEAALKSVRVPYFDARTPRKRRATPRVENAKAAPPKCESRKVPHRNGGHVPISGSAAPPPPSRPH